MIHPVSNPHSCCSTSSKEKLVRVQNNRMIKEVPNDAVGAASTEFQGEEGPSPQVRPPAHPHGGRGATADFCWICHL